MAKIKDIAKQLYLSVSTVSKAINNAPDISQDTRKKVLDYMLENNIEIKTKKKPLHNICIILEDIGIDERFIAYEIIDGFRLASNIYEYTISLKTTSHNMTNFNYEKEMLDGGFSGAFIIGVNKSSPLYKQLLTTKFPTIILDNIIDNNYVSSIGVDNMHSMYNMVSFLKTRNYSKIAFLSGEQDSLASVERFAGYVAGLTTNKMQYDEKLVFFGNFSENCCLPYIDSIIAEKPDCVICAGDLIAIGLIKELNKHGITVPRDMAVTGFDNIALLEQTVSLTTIAQDFPLIGKNAFLSLRQQIKNNISTRSTIYGKLIKRNSTR